MVISIFLTLPAQAAPKAPLQALDPPRRAVVMVALVGLLLVGLLLVVAIMVAGRWARRISRERVPARDWSREPKPWEQVSDSPAVVEGAKGDNLGHTSSETRHDPFSEDTRAD